MSTVPEVATVTPEAVHVLDLRSGDVVRVRRAEAIFATLDGNGMLDGLPFMPEMLKYCGRTLPVTQRADKTCAGDGVVRRMYNTVHLRNIRCDGSAHDGCQAACLMFWKEAWLERAADSEVRSDDPDATDELSDEGQAYVDDVLQPFTSHDTDAGTRYRCQATNILTASDRLRFRQADQFARDLRHRSLRDIVRGLFIEFFNLGQLFSRRFPRRLQIAGGRLYPFVVGKLEKGTTPAHQLEVGPGDLVRVKTKREIEATLDTTGRNRGLSFDGEMSNYCGRTARVRARVNHIVEESTGEMIAIKSDCVILEGVVCTADYHRFCTRAIFPYWREIWLEKVEDGAGATGGGAAPCTTRRRRDDDASTDAGGR